MVVKTNYPIKQVLRKSELVERMVAWFVKLSKFNIQYESHGPMKTQFMVDFMQRSQSQATTMQHKLTASPRIGC